MHSRDGSRCPGFDSRAGSPSLRRGGRCPLPLRARVLLSLRLSRVSVPSLHFSHARGAGRLRYATQVRDLARVRLPGGSVGRRSVERARAHARANERPPARPLARARDRRVADATWPRFDSRAGRQLGARARGGRAGGRSFVRSCARACARARGPDRRTNRPRSSPNYSRPTRIIRRRCLGNDHCL